MIKMATKIKRASNILEAFTDTVPTDEKLNKVLDAFAFTYRRNETLTQPVKATEFIQQIRSHVRQIVKDYNQSTAIRELLENSNFDIDL